MKQEIIKFAKELGFDDLKFASYNQTTFKKKYLTHLKKSFDSNKTCAVTPSFKYQKAQFSKTDTFKTVISLCVAYPHSSDKIKNNSNSATFCSSSWGTDYHRVITPKLTNLVSFLKENYGVVNVEYCVDHGKYTDAFWSLASGLCVKGVNSLMIHPKFGSFIYLATVLVDIDIQADNVYKTDCLNCNKCIKNCPTKAISEDGVDASRCLSYLTQAKKSIANDWSDAFDSSLYGCDICQLCCPHNKTNFTHQEECLPTGIEVVDLIRLLNLTNKQFKKQYGHLAGSWRGKLVLVRNGLIIAANRGDLQVLPYINKLLAEDLPDWFIEDLHKINKVLKSRQIN